MKSSEFYFHVGSIDGETCVSICPIEFFHEEGCLADSGHQEEFDSVMNSMEEFEELTDATYGFEGSASEAKSKMLAAGFQQSVEFDTYMERDGAYDE